MKLKPSIDFIHSTDITCVSSTLYDQDHLSSLSMPSESEGTCAAVIFIMHNHGIIGTLGRSVYAL